jgi:uncharacterized protein YbjT (DUF2867 family)
MSDGPILVLGASGTVGAALTAQLVQAGRPVRAFFDPSTPQRAAFAEAVEVIHGTFDDDDALRAAADGARAMFLLTPPAAAQVRWQRAAVQAAVTAGVARIVKLSAFDSGPGSPLQMGRWHHDGEQAVRQAGPEWTILRPQYFTQNLLGAIQEAARTGVLAGAAAPELRLGFVDAHDVAAVAVVSLTSSGYAGEVLVPTGPEALSFAELAVRVGRFLNRDVRYQQRPRAELGAQLAARGMPDWHVQDFFAIHGAAASDTVTAVVPDACGRAAHRVEDVLRRAGVTVQARVA